MSDTTLSPLQELNQAVQTFINAHSDEAVMVRGAVVCWETMSFDDDGDARFEVNYVSLPNTSMAETIGILDIATDQVRGDVFGD